MQVASDRQGVAILGAGSIGASWAALFAGNGLAVRIWDPAVDEPTVRARVMQGIQSLQGAIDGADNPHLTFCQTPAEAVDGATFIQESGPENLATKRRLYADIVDALDPAAIVASSTSTLMPSALQQDCPFAERLLTGHPVNPPHLIPIVEIVPGRRTDASVIVASCDFYRSVGRHPVVLGAERPGHLVNRLQAALWREALHAVQSGLATISDVDLVMTQSIGPRWAFMGPFMTFHMGGGTGGLSHFCDHIGPSFEHLWDDLKSPKMSAFRHLADGQMRERLGNGEPADLSAWRDRFLADMLEVSARADRALASIRNPARLPDPS